MEKEKSKKTHKIYTDEFKNQIVQLYLNVKKKYDIIREYGTSIFIVDIWVKRATTSSSF
ncbi:MAG: transposase [Fusobacteriaceae bacterium]|nr:transposase [Fusobacteriaceae bacterium]